MCLHLGLNANTISTTLIEFDPIKSQKNVDERQLPFALVDGFDWDVAIVVEDIRKANPREEKRYEKSCTD
jgi:uncharacterized DUF497 family protein